jgi:hypothetical protein
LLSYGLADLSARVLSICRHCYCFPQAGPAADSDIKEFGMSCHELGPSLLHAYDLDLGDKLRDDAARVLRSSRKQGSDQANGFHAESNPWLEAFQEVSAWVDWQGHA